MFAVAVAAVAYYQYQRKLERQRQFRALALGHGLDFSIEDPFHTLGEPFALLQRGDGRGVENVLWGEWQGLELRAFDYWYYDESTDSKGHTSKSYSRFDCVLALDRRPVPVAADQRGERPHAAGGRPHVP